MTMSLDDIEPGTLISFRSKNVNDTVLWQGTLESKGTYRSIKHMFNPKAYNEAVRQSDATVPSDISLLHYFIITVDNSSTEQTTWVHAKEWIQAGSLAVVNLGNKVSLEIQDPLSNVQRIQSILANSGYKSKIIS